MWFSFVGALLLIYNLSYYINSVISSCRIDWKLFVFLYITILNILLTIFCCKDAIWFTAWLPQLLTVITTMWIFFVIFWSCEIFVLAHIALWRVCSSDALYNVIILFRRHAVLWRSSALSFCLGRYVDAHIFIAVSWFIIITFYCI